MRKLPPPRRPHLHSPRDKLGQQKAARFHRLRNLHLPRHPPRPLLLTIIIFLEEPLRALPLDQQQCFCSLALSFTLSAVPNRTRTSSSMVNLPAPATRNQASLRKLVRTLLRGVQRFSLRVLELGNGTTDIQSRRCIPSPRHQAISSDTTGKLERQNSSMKLPLVVKSLRACPTAHLRLILNSRHR
jgi:hypothetical protein